MENEIEKLAIEALPDVFLNGRIIFPNDTAQNRRMWAKGYKAALSKGGLELISDFVNQLRSHVNVMQSSSGNDDLAEKYYSGQDLICAMVIQEINKYAALSKGNSLFDKSLDLLRSLHDIQNGPPLVQDEEEWRKIMEETQRFLFTHETTT